MSGGRASRQKGLTNERQLVLILRAHGMDAKRVPLSGAAQGFKGDIWADGLRFEVKVRADGFREIYRWLGDDNDVLAFRADRKEWMVAMPLKEWLRMTGRTVQDMEEA